MNRKVLIVDDERSIVDILRYNLEKNDMTAVCAYDGAEGLRLARECDPDVILLDVMLPEMDGFEVCRTLRAEGNNVPIIMITAREEETDKVFGLELGADDYITKPFNPVEVLARVKSQLRRFLQLGAAVKAPSVISVGGIELDHDAKRVTLDGEPVALTPKEYDILYYLMQHPGKVYTPAELYSAVWNEAPVGIDNTVAVHIRHLREKLEIDPSNPRYLKVVWGKGYKLEGDRQ